MSGIIAQNAGRHTGLIKAAGGGGAWNLIQTLTASSSATLDFTSGIDSTYDEYVFKFINIHPGTNSVSLMFQGNVAGGSGYNETMTTTQFRTYQNEAGDDTDLIYYTGGDQAQGTAFQYLSGTINTGNDNSTSGYMQLFNPSSTTFVKHFIATAQILIDDSYSMQYSTAGYFNTTSAIDEIQFKMSTGNIDSGTISLFGIT